PVTVLDDDESVQITNVTTEPHVFNAKVTFHVDGPQGTKVYVEYGEQADYGFRTLDFMLPGSQDKTIPLLFLAANTTHHFRVVATTPTGGSGKTGDLTFTTLDVPAGARDLKDRAERCKYVLCIDPLDAFSPDIKFGQDMLFRYPLPLGTKDAKILLRDSK